MHHRFMIFFLLFLTFESRLSAAPPVDCKKSLNIRATQAAPLSFGDLLVSGAGTAVIGTNSSRYTNGLVITANGLVSAAELIVTGCKDSPYNISIGASTTIISGVNSMVVDSFSTDPVMGLLDPTGKQSLFIGATLHIGNGQPAGVYSGAFLVEVIYQ